MFAVKRGGLALRFDVTHNIPKKNLATSLFPHVPLGSLCVEEPNYGTSSTAIERTSEEQPKYIRITDFTDLGIPDNHTFKTTKQYMSKHFLKDNDILFARTGATVGKTFLYNKKLGESVFAGYCIRFRLDANKVLPAYVYWFTKTKQYSEWVNSIQRPSGQPNINKEEFKSLEIPLPPYDIQVAMVQELEDKLQSLNSKKEDSYRVEREFQIKLTNDYNLSLSPESQVCFAIRLKQLDGVIDVKRYAVMKNYDSFCSVADICEIAEKKVNATSFGEDIIDWIRIDDLENKPLDITEIRTQQAIEIEGSFFQVEVGDILVARLGPTILNKKIVMVRSLERTTIASSEFLVLRCKKGIQPEAVMSILKTDYFKELMYSHSRGSTPSRYRLNREDMLALPFPDISVLQDKLADESVRLTHQIKFLRESAEAEWSQAKEQFEKKLLG